MPLSAAIDIGSNTIRLLIGNVRDNKIEHVFYERKITRLAEGISQSKILKDEHIEASIAVLKEFSSIIQRQGVKAIRAVATSALRETYNSEIFIRKVFADTGISIEVISGEKEAELILKGILSSFPDLSFPDSSLIIDIGGGSTEWIFCKGRYPIDMGSLPIGVVKLHENFIKTDPISEANISELSREILTFLEILKKRIGHQVNPVRKSFSNGVNRKTCFIGTAGTFTTLASIDLKLKTYSREKIHLHGIPLSRLRDMSRRLLALPLRERKKVAGLEPERADLIIPGIQFTINAMEFFKFDELMVSDYGLLEGVLLDTLEERNEKNIQETHKP
ncbi:MAG: Ppx/GppA phosphatase family protein [Thermodesulfovibrionales bacterium]|nr:Ppx/GppA phosphatase family protein [Thermodesulfovibrionales bacterium]